MGKSGSAGQHIVSKLSENHVEISNHQIRKKGSWEDELASVLWSYRTTPQFTIGEMPFQLTYGVDVVIPVEIGELNLRLLLSGGEEAVEKDLIDETREMAYLRETKLKQRIALQYNGKVLGRSFEEGDLVLRRLTDPRRRQIGKARTE
ncbi:uncharacterized protein [Arachis hypogaea]|uniref:uncharacterized protein n=1 Tax=Arachis hypogaea TaxID=3818 RepID=UPI003B212685